MARMIGSTKSWLWWLAGFLCAVLFDGANRAPSAEPPQPPYGVATPPPVNQPTTTEEQQKQAVKLIADYLAPVPAAEPTAEAKGTVEKLIRGLGSNDFKVREEASADIVKQGPAALGALREAAKGSDLEVSTRAAAAVAAVEKNARQVQVDGLKKLGAAGQLVVALYQVKVRAEISDANAALDAAEKKADKDEVEKVRAAVKAATEKMNALNGLVALISPTPMKPLYGVRAPDLDK